jgi:glucose/mannose transport system permease protein
MAVRWSRWSPQLALAPAVLVTLIAFFGSIGWTIFMSMTRSRRFPEYFFDPAEWGRQYNRLFKDDVWSVALKNLVILGVGSCLAIVFGFILAALIDREKRGENIFRTVFLYPLAV